MDAGVGGSSDGAAPDVRTEPLAGGTPGTPAPGTPESGSSSAESTPRRSGLEDHGDGGSGDLNDPSGGGGGGGTSGPAADSSSIDPRSPGAVRRRRAAAPGEAAGLLAVVLMTLLNIVEILVPGLPGRQHGAKKTLVLDLDETLIHSTSRGSRRYDFMVEVLIDKHVCLYYVYKRPHVDLFLRKAAEWFKIVIFTASMPEYADPVIDWLDGNRTIVSKRYFRQSCTARNGTFVKNLEIVESDLSQVCLIDNAPFSYALHQDNGIPIDTWIDDPHDEALLDLLPFLDALRFAEDVRSVLSLRM